MAAISFATLLLVFMLSWQFGSYETMINASVKIQTGHLQIQKKGYQEKRDIRFTVANLEKISDALETTPEIEAYTFRAEGFSLVSSKDRTYGVLVLGIDPHREPSVSSLKNMTRHGSFLSAEDTNKALVGNLLARNLKVDLGDELVILGQGSDGSIAATAVRVKGIFNSGQDDFDRGLVHLPLRFFQEVYSMGKKANAGIVICRSIEDVAVVKDILKQKLSNLNDIVVKDWKELTPGLVQAIKMDLVSGFIFYLILIVVVSFSILNTFLMAIFERTREFGVMMAMGTTPGRLTRILLMESLGMTLIGVVAGCAAGALVTTYFQVHGILIPGSEEIARQFGLPERMYPKLSVLSTSVGAGIVMVVTSFTASYPALKVQRLKPVEALLAV
jgi:ABC-type lipoprotein release transport system permease subunit